MYSMSEALPSIQREIRQTRPFKNRRQEALVALMRTADDVRRFLGDGIEGAGITLQQYNVLRILRGADGEPLPTLEIGARMIERTPGVTRLLDRLEEDGLVERNRCAADRRRVLCSIRPAGMRLLSGLDPEIAERDRAAFGDLDDTELTEMLRMLAHVRRALADHTHTDP